MAAILFGLNVLSDEVITPLSSSWIGDPGGRLNKKDGLTRYGDSHVKHKTS